MGITIGGGSSIPPDGAISTEKIADEAVTEGKLDPGVTAQLGGGVSAAHFINARFTLTSGTPVLTSSVTAAGTGYITPFKGNYSRLYYNSSWQFYQLSEISITFSALNASTLYDVFLYWNGSAVVAETVAWTNTTTRATALTTQDGVYVKTGDPTRLYFASFYLDGSKQCHYHVGTQSTASGTAKIYFQNYYNQIDNAVRLYIPVNYWTYSTATWRQANADSNFKCEFVQGLSENQIEAIFSSGVNTSSGSVYGFVGVGVDSTTAYSGFNAFKVVNSGYIRSQYSGYLSSGFHYVAGIEYASAATCGFTGYDTTLPYRMGLELKAKC